MKKKPLPPKTGGEIIKPASGDLFDRVVSILEQARANVLRAVNSNMVIAYWLIGREIVQELQAGDERAAYGKQVLSQLSARLTKQYGKGYSVTNLRYSGCFIKPMPIAGRRCARRLVMNSDRRIAARKFITSLVMF